jgi:branched-chain amino acid transport system ATP-binding protein
MGLSPRLVQQNFELIQQINRSGVTIFVVEQNAAMALAIAHRGYVLRTGEIVMSGSAPELLRSQGIRQAYLGEM